jgi:epoxyqueuosine reductase QueG
VRGLVFGSLSAQFDIERNYFIRDQLGKQYHDEKEKSLAAKRDYEAALFHQLQADKEYEQEQVETAIRMSKKQQEGELEAAEVGAMAAAIAAAAVPDRNGNWSI